MAMKEEEEEEKKLSNVYFEKITFFYIYQIEIIVKESDDKSH
jgi:hypothetical protein